MEWNRYIDHERMMMISYEELKEVWHLSQLSLMGMLCNFPEMCRDYEEEKTIESILSETVEEHSFLSYLCA